MHVTRIVEFPEEGIAVIYDEHGKFVTNRENTDILDVSASAQGKEEVKKLHLVPKKTEESY